MIMAWNHVSWILSSANATSILLTSPSNILSQWGQIKQSNNKILHDLYFTYKFHDQNLYKFAFNMLLTRSTDMSNFAVTT